MAQEGAIVLTLKGLNLAAAPPLFVEEARPDLLLEPAVHRVHEIVSAQYRALDEKEPQDVLFSGGRLGFDAYAGRAALRCIARLETQRDVGEA